MKSSISVRGPTLHAPDSRYALAKLPFGLLITRDDAPEVLDPRIVTVPFAALLIVR